jgi:hypothetical protein
LLKSAFDTNLTLKECLNGKCTVAEIQGNSTFSIRHSIKKIKTVLKLNKYDKEPKNKKPPYKERKKSA